MYGLHSLIEDSYRNILRGNANIANKFGTTKGKSSFVNLIFGEFVGQGFSNKFYFLPYRYDRESVMILFTNFSPQSGDKGTLLFVSEKYSFINFKSGSSIIALL